MYKNDVPTITDWLLSFQTKEKLDNNYYDVLELIDNCYIKFGESKTKIKLQQILDCLDSRQTDKNKKSISRIKNLIDSEMYIEDSYNSFLKETNISLDKYTDIGMDLTKTSSCVDVNKNWTQLLSSIEESRNEDLVLQNTIYKNFDLLKGVKDENLKKEKLHYVYVRTFGNKGDNESTKRMLLKRFYFEVLDMIIFTDGTNNNYPQKKIEEALGKRRKKGISEYKYKYANYTVAHIFGKTKNIYAFTALWNIALIPNMFDSLSGHESSGVLQKVFQDKLQTKIKKMYPDTIKKYNEIVNEITPKITSWLEKESARLEKLKTTDLKLYSEKSKQLDTFGKEIYNDFKTIDI